MKKDAIDENHSSFHYRPIDMRYHCNFLATPVLIDFSLTVKAATLISISGHAVRLFHLKTREIGLYL